LDLAKEFGFFDPFGGLALVSTRRTRSLSFRLAEDSGALLTSRIAVAAYGYRNPCLGRILAVNACIWMVPF
jgi:hypothetical protein